MNQDHTGKPARSRKILVLEEDRDNLGVLLEPLRWEGYDAQGVSDLNEALKAISLWQPLIVLIDMANDEDGLMSLRKIRQKIPHASCLLLSENSNTEAIIRGLDAGADDYIVKPFVPLELLARIRTHLRIRDLHEQLLYANEKLKELVDIDDLTGLFNMRSLYQKLDFEMQRARRFGRHVSVVMLDMDNFKTVNDGHDHLFGSFVISEVGKIIKANTRNIDIPARYGGDEFLIVLTEVNYDGSLYFCERLRKSVEASQFVSGDDSMRLTVSIGFSMTKPGEVLSARELVRQADHALYEAKRRGRNQVCFYEPGMDRQSDLVSITEARHQMREDSQRLRVLINSESEEKENTASAHIKPLRSEIKGTKKKSSRQVKKKAVG